MPSREENERRRYRSGTKVGRMRGRLREGSALTGHPAMFAMRPALELGPFPEGGGYPLRFVEAAAGLLGAHLTDIVHLCAGSVRGGRATLDYRRDAGADIVADVRWLPFRPASLTAILVDPPYSPEYAEALWGTSRIYPPPAAILRECATVLAPGGRVGLLHHITPAAQPGLVRLGCHGVTTGPDYRIRALTIFQRDQETLPI